MTTTEKVMEMHERGINTRSIARELDLREGAVRTTIEMQHLKRDKAGFDYKKAYEELREQNDRLILELKESRKKAVKMHEKVHVLENEVREYAKWLKSIEKSVFGKGAK